MGLLQEAYRTYEFMADRYMGVYDAERKEPLCPVSHLITAAELEITLDTDGNFLSASEVEKVDKKVPKIIIPVTEASAGRSGTGVAKMPHPLCEQLGYLGGHNAEKLENYLNQLSEWASSPYGHPKLNAVLAYVKGGTILDDLLRYDLIKLDKDGNPDRDKSLVRWRVADLFSSDPEECWKDRKLFRAFQEFYASKQEGQQFCMVSGETVTPARQHPKGIISLYGNAKLISANDNSGFTFRGRIGEDWQAASVSYEASQKAHSALRWVAVNQGVMIGGRTFLCWNPEGEVVPQPTGIFAPRSETAILKATDYRKKLAETLLGAKESLPKNAKAILAAFDAATTGRLSVTYYNELQASDFLQRLHDWDRECCWINGPFGIQSPYLSQIVDCAFGTQRKELNQTKFVTDDRVMREQMQRLIACRVDSARMPEDILQALVNRASYPLAYEMANWRKLMFVTCAAIQKHYVQDHKEDFCMEWELSRKDRSFQFGRLLAVMEKAEEDYYYFQDRGRGDGERQFDGRQTNAMKSMNAFKRRPWTVYDRVKSRLIDAYIPRLSPYLAKRYTTLMNEISADIIHICTEENELNQPLSEYYLIGYELQRNEFFKSSKNDDTDNMEEE